MRASSDLLGWLLLRAAMQTTQILLMTRYLGAEGYGIFVAILAISSFFAPLAGLGIPAILLRDGARDPANISKLIGNVLALWWPSTLLFTAFAFLGVLWTSQVNLPEPLLAVFLFADIAATSLVDIIGRLEQSQHRTRVFGLLQAGLPLFRVMALLLCISRSRPDIQGWIGAYAGVSLAYTAATLWWVNGRYHPGFPRRRNWRMAREGIPFSIGGLSIRLQTEFNKPMLAQLGAAQVGNFSAAQRVVDLASLPLTAMQEALWPRYYAGSGANRQVWLVSGFLVLFALFCSSLLTIVAPLLPLALGVGFTDSARLLAKLAWLPALQVIRNLLSVAVVSDYRQSYLIWMYITCGFGSILFNSVLIAKFGPAGAIWSAYLVESLAIFMLLFNRLLSRSAKRGH